MTSAILHRLLLNQLCPVIGVAFFGKLRIEVVNSNAWKMRQWGLKDQRLFVPLFRPERPLIKAHGREEIARSNALPLKYFHILLQFAVINRMNDLRPGLLFIFSFRPS